MIVKAETMAAIFDGGTQIGIGIKFTDDEDVEQSRAIRMDILLPDLEKVSNALRKLADWVDEIKATHDTKIILPGELNG